MQPHKQEPAENTARDSTYGRGQAWQSPRLARSSRVTWRASASARSLSKNSIFGLPIELVLAASMWWYVQKVLIPYERADAAAHGIPRGNLSDLYPRWLGARELLVKHRNPYSAEVTREIQAGYY